MESKFGVFVVITVTFVFSTYWQARERTQGLNFERHHWK
jgi:hypothetical protein